MKAEQIIHRMEDMYNSGNTGVRPTTFTYNALLHCWANSLREDAGDQAKKWIQKMTDMYESGNAGVKPSIVSYATCIDAYAKAGSNYENKGNM